MNAISWCNKILEYSFYSIFFFVPLFFLGNTSELFEFNKMWLTFGLAIIIGSAWIIKMIIERKIIIRKTPLDIPIVLFLISQIISSIFSLDSHVSLWGYYSRFNGGLLSYITYIFLYYAFVSNLEMKQVIQSVFVSLFSGLITVIWGFPSHFGYDPTCLIFQGVMDTNCWTEAFKPTIRVFSTLGQPAWFAAYMNILIPVSAAYVLINIKQKKRNTMTAYFILMLLFYICLIFANTRAGTLAFFVTDIIFWIILFYKKIFSFKKAVKYFLVIHIAFALCNFFFGAPFGNLDRFTFPQLQKNFAAHAQTPEPSSKKKSVVTITGITDSAQIRMIVWKGAISAWKSNPIFGTGVETFAFAYYRYRPAEHNLTSEWDYLYNKAHNEYLNFLATTGIVGLGTYLAIILIFIFVTLKLIITFKDKDFRDLLLILSLFIAYLTILITNFFGFSVVIINLYLFLIPAFIFLITGVVNQDKIYEFNFSTFYKKNKISINATQWVFIVVVIIIAIYMILGLFRYWYADTLYALGSNLDHASKYQQASMLLQDAVNIEPQEPVYTDELAVNYATLATALFMQKDESTAEQLAKKAIELDDQVVETHPNNVVFWKNRLRIFYSLASGDPKNQEKYIAKAIGALKMSVVLAPTDAKIYYNLGVLLGQAGNGQEGINVLEKTIKLKPDYLEAYNALGLLYHQMAINQTTASDSGQEKIINPQLQQKAVDTYQFILDNLSPDNKEIKKTLESWKER